MYANEGPNIWTLTYNNSGRVYAMVINSSNQSILYEAGLDSGIYKSTNAGLNWTQVNSGLTYNHVQALAISNSNPNVLYAGTDQNGGGNSGIYKTTDGGNTWTFATNGITDTKAIQSITIHPSNPNIAWTAVFDGVNPATDGVYKTTDGGANWFASSTGITNKNILTVIVNPFNGNSLFAGSSLILPGSTGPSTMYKSYDAGANWFLVSNGLPTGTTTGDPIRAMSFSTIDTSVVLAGLFLNDTAGGTYLTTNGGTLWIKKHNGLPNVVGTLPRSIIIRPGTTNQFFVGLDGGGANSRGVWRTVDGGNNWVDFNGAAMQNTFTVRALTFRTQGDSTIYAGAATASPPTSRGVYEYSWPLPPQPLCEQFTSTTFPPTGWTVVYSGTLYWTRDAVSGFGLGTGSAKYDMWNASSGTNQSLITLAFYPSVLTDSLRIDMAYAPYPASPPFAQDSLVILTSTNSGSTYTSLVRLGPTQMQTAPAQGSLFTPTASQWAKRSYGLPVGTNMIQFLGKSDFGNNLYLDSICIGQLVGISQNEGNVPKQYSLGQNYPNPFNPVTRISYGLPKAGNVKLIVFDILGREVETLVNEFKRAGTYDIDFNASYLSSGAYFYKIESGEFVDSKKMIILK